MNSDVEVVEELRHRLDAEVQASGGSRVPPPSLVTDIKRRRARRQALRSSGVVAASLALFVGVAAMNGADDKETSTQIASPADALLQAPDLALREVTPAGLSDGLGRLRSPSVVPVAGDFFIWGPTGGNTPGGSDDPNLGPLGTPAAAVFDTDSGRWNRVPRGPLGPRLHPAATWTGEEVVIAGGSGEYNHGELLADAAAYNPATQEWRPLPSLPSPRAAATALSLGDRVVLAGGDTKQTSAVEELLILDEHEWTTLALSHPVQTAVPLGANRLLAFGFSRDSHAIHASVVDATTGAVVAVSALQPQLEGPASEWSVGDEGERVVLALGDGTTVALYELSGSGTAKPSWSTLSHVESSELALGGTRFSSVPHGELLLGEGNIASVSSRGVAVFVPETGEILANEPMPQRCDATMFGTDVGGVMYWRDHSCNGGAAAHLVVPEAN